MFAATICVAALEARHVGSTALLSQPPDRSLNGTTADASEEERVRRQEAQMDLLEKQMLDIERDAAQVVDTANGTRAA